MPRGVGPIVLAILSLAACQSPPAPDRWSGTLAASSASRPSSSPPDRWSATRQIRGRPETRALRASSVIRTGLMPQPGYSMYVYILPERDVPQAMLNQLTAFHHCLASPGDIDHSGSVALMLLPMKHDPMAMFDPRRDQIDVEFSHDLLRPLDIKGRRNNEVYFVAVRQPLRVNVPPAEDPVIIELGRISPDYVVPWLVSFQDNIERSAYRAPADPWPYIRSAASIIMSLGALIGIPVAHASPHACGQSADFRRPAS